MEDMVKEVLEYINPKTVIDNAPAQKKPAPKASKVEEIPADPYAGFDTALYK